MRLITLLPGALDRQVRRDAGLAHGSYTVLATLSEAPDRSMRMTELARNTVTSASRLVHVGAALEERGWVTRRPCPEDRRGLVASLTDDCVRVLAETESEPVAQVRATVP